MAKYLLKTSCGYVGTDTEEDISDWLTDKLYEDYEEGRGTIVKELEYAAIAQQGFEWYVERVEDDE